MNSGGHSPGDAEGDTAGGGPASGDRTADGTTNSTEAGTTGDPGADADIPNGTDGDTSAGAPAPSDRREPPDQRPESEPESAPATTVTGEDTTSSAATAAGAATGEATPEPDPGPGPGAGPEPGPDPAAAADPEPTAAQRPVAEPQGPTDTEPAADAAAAADTADGAEPADRPEAPAASGAADAEQGDTEPGEAETPAAAAVDTTADSPTPGAAPPTRRRRRWPKVLAACLAGLLVLGAAGAGWAYWRTEESLDSIKRIPQAMPTMPEEQQPQRIEGDSLVFLLVGLDAESAPDTGVGDTEVTADGEPAAWEAGAARSDTMMLLQIPADRSAATIVSLPRDSWVEVPGHGSSKLNAAYSWGGPALMVETVQNLTDLRIDHLAVIDWAGFRELTDAVGGVRVDGERLDGRDALDYVRERKGLPEGDLDRNRRQQHFLRSLLEQTLSSDTLSSPTRLNGLLNAVGDVVSVDDGLSNSDIRDLAWGLRSLDDEEVRFMNAPVVGTETIGGQSVVILDEEAAAPLWKAMKEDAVGELVERGEAPEDLGEEVA
ncbi:LCP family protein [Streptomyces bohaiensis]